MFYKKFFSNLYKSMIYKFFKLVYGEIDSVTTDLNHLEIIEKKIKIEKSEYKVFFCKESILYTDRVHDTAIIKNNSVIEGPSFQLRDNIYEDSTKNSVLKNGTPKLRKNMKGSILSLLTGGGGNSNYWHWLFDVLPRIQIVNQVNNQDEIDYYLFPGLEKKFQNETLDILNIPKRKRLSSKYFRHLKSDQIIATTHPYTFLNDPLIDSLRIPTWIFDFLRNQFSKTKNFKYLEEKSYPSKIFINRKDGTGWRYIINENEVEEFLISKGFKSITLSNYTFLDQVKIFNSVDFVIGLHGAGFANLIFSKPGTKVLELKSTTAGDAIKNLAINNKLIYNDISLEPKTIDFKNQAGDIEIDLNILNKSLK